MSFFRKLSQYSSQIALYEEGQGPLSYQHLVQRCDLWAQKLQPRRLAFISCRNQVDTIASYLACLRTNTVALLLRDSLDTTLFKKLVESYRPHYIFAPKDTLKGYVLRGTELYSSASQCLLELESSSTRPSKLEAQDELALLLSTSGSTGSPKMVRLTYKNLESNADAICDYLSIQSTDRTISTMPLNYSYGLSILNTHLNAGAQIVLTERAFTEGDFWNSFKKHAINSFGAVPFSYEILKRLRFHEMELPKLNYLTQAGGKIKPELLRYFLDLARSRGFKWIGMYGQTEATARMSYLDWEWAEKKFGSIGKAIPGGAFEIDAQTSELIYKGPNVSLGYAENLEDLARSDENRGTLHTGDLAKCDAEGFYYIVGRSKRFLKIFGNRVNLEEIEHIIHDMGFDAACAGQDDLLEVFVQALPENKIKNELSVSLSQKSGLHPSAFRFYFVNKLPRNEAGKLLYASLESLKEGSSL